MASETVRHMEGEQQKMSIMQLHAVTSRYDTVMEPWLLNLQDERRISEDFTPSPISLTLCVFIFLFFLILRRSKNLLYI